MVNLHHMWLLVQKTAMFVHKLKFILLPQLITTLNNYVWSTGLLFQSTFCQPSKFMTSGMVPVKGSNMAASTWYSSTVSTHLSRPCNRILAHCDVHVNVIANLNSAICIVSIFCYSCYHHSPHPHFLPTHSLYMLVQYQCNL